MAEKQNPNERELETIYRFQKQIPAVSEVIGYCQECFDDWVEIEEQLVAEYIIGEIVSW